MSRSSRYRADLVARGLCRAGPHPRGEDGSATLCRAHQDDYNAYMRKRGDRLRAEGKCRGCQVLSETAYCAVCAKRRNA